MDWLYLSVCKRKESGCGVGHLEAKVGILFVGRIDFAFCVYLEIYGFKSLLLEHSVHENGNIVLNIVSKLMLITHNYC